MRWNPISAGRWAAGNSGPRFGTGEGHQVARSFDGTSPGPDGQTGRHPGRRPGTDGGLAFSSHAGETWTMVLWGAPVSTVETTSDGSVYAFVVGRGLVRSKEEPLSSRRLTTILVT